MYTYEIHQEIKNTKKIGNSITNEYHTSSRLSKINAKIKEVNVTNQYNNLYKNYIIIKRQN